MQCTSSLGEAPAKPSSPSTPATKQQFIDHVVSSFTATLDAETLHQQSCELTSSLRSKLDIPDSIAMLPSFIDQTPTGREQGDVLSIDIRGSTMRAAIVTLEPSAVKIGDRLRIRKQESWPITVTLKSLTGVEFFDWIANNIQNFLGRLTEAGLVVELRALPAGLVWSFPLEQFELSDGNLREMQKGFVIGQELQGQSIKKCIYEAFAKRGLEIQLEAILNDSVSALLALSYIDPSTELSIIAGTGYNSGVRLPATVINPAKMKHQSNSQRDAMQESSKILVDAKLSVIRQGIMPREKTTWDSRLDKMVPFKPGVLGLELQVGGLFLGELVRQIVMDAIKLVGLFDGHLPELTQAPMSWGLQHGAVLEVSAPADADLPQLVAKSFGLPFKPSLEDICFVRQICQAVIKRAAAYVAVSTYSMRSLQVLSRDAGDHGVGMDACKVACLGSVIEKYPGFMTKSQEYLDQLQHVSSQKSGPKFGAIHLQACAESSLTGVAVAALLGKAPDTLEVTKLPESYDVVGKTTGSVSVVESKSRDGVIIQGRPAKQSSFWAKIRSLFAVCRRCT
ncbi:hypothetical protein FOTG_16687 [Fusarium oxysporum f. sp. vasinfectum 25433]|uniref:Phosphotransferase n=1 Tax=Fusarium oxysporum f. sp. vasinfectum 25433 TaxID=1089449 RepID=X0KMZ4_FUSOX|nr:hypothetical protein FOTG_16687 [Fusarium oxysporum f. sp. vasinfectum 25433]